MARASRLDAVVDHYFLVLDSVGAEVEALEDVALDNLGDDTVERIHDLKRDAVSRSRKVRPVAGKINL